MRRRSTVRCPDGTEEDFWNECNQVYNSPEAGFSDPNYINAPDEFNWFMEIARSTRLNPLRRQIYCFLFHVNDAAKRQMVVVTGIDGYRAIAARSGNYRPGKAVTTFDEALVDPDTNPLGISHSEVTVYMHSHGEWHEITERADWSEYAPIVDLWGEDETGRRRKTGKRQLEPKKDGWRRMGRILLEKCAEARALRLG